MSTDDEFRCLTTEGVHELTGIAVGTLRGWRARTRRDGVQVGPPSFKREGVVLYRYAELAKWIAAGEAASDVDVEARVPSRRSA